MVHKTLLRTLLIVFLTVYLTACASVATADREPPYHPNENVDAGFLLQDKKTLTDLMETPELVSSTESLFTPAIQDSPFSIQETFIEIYEQVNPSVVNVQVTYTPNGTELSKEFAPYFPQIPGFPENTPEFGPPMSILPQHSQGSGFVYDEEGHIVTNSHVVHNVNEISITFADGTVASATLVGSDPDSDLAVVKVEVESDLLEPVTIGDSDSLKVGQLVVAIGNPFGLEGSMTMGIISGLGRLLPAVEHEGFSIPDIIQTDAAINPGNSGGPLLNLEGEVIGVNTAITSPSRVFAGIGYAVPATMIDEVVPALISDGQIEHPWLGITGATLTPELAEAIDLVPEQRGVLIAEVIADGPAHDGGLRGSAIQTTLGGQTSRISGDLITGVDGQSIDGINELISYLLHETKIGDTIVIDVLREGERLDFEVKLEPRPEVTP